MHIAKAVLLLDFVPNLAISLFRTFTSGTPGALITVVVGEVRTTVLPGANVSRRPQRSRSDLLDTFLANFSCSEVSVRGIWFWVRYEAGHRFVLIDIVSRQHPLELWSWLLH